MSMGRTDVLFWLVTILIMLGVLAVAVPLRHTNYNHEVVDITKRRGRDY